MDTVTSYDPALDPTSLAELPPPLPLTNEDEHWVQEMQSLLSMAPPQARSRLGIVMEDRTYIVFDTDPETANSLREYGNLVQSDHLHYRYQFSYDYRYDREQVRRWILELARPE